VKESAELKVNRRNWMLQVLGVTTALGSTIPIAAAQTHAHSNAVDGKKSSTATGWGPTFFSAEQDETVIALGDRIVPGSKEALCNRLVDSVLAIESEKNKSDFLQALSAFDSKAESLHKEPFRKLSASQQDGILAGASQENDKLHPEFSIIKEWMADAYWSSQEGLRELGSKGRMAWESVADCSSS
jgi:gluconate 2-dehydrogenase subunit 3-like protein